MLSLPSTGGWAPARTEDIGEEYSKSYVEFNGCSEDTKGHLSVRAGAMGKVPRGSAFVAIN